MCLLVEGTGSWCGWLNSPGGPGACAGPLVGRQAPSIRRPEEDPKTVHVNTGVLVVEQNPQKAAASVFVHRGSPGCCLLLWEPPRSASRFGQDPFKLLPLCWKLECVRFCICPLRAEAVSYSLSALLYVNRRTTGLGSPMWGVDPLLLGGEPLQFVIIFLFVGHLAWVVDPDYTLAHCCSFLAALVVENLFY